MLVLPRDQLAAAREFAAVVGEKHCLTDPAELRTYESDGLAGPRVRPLAVVLPASTAEVASVVRIARAHGLPIVPRGAGTGLSGGALPVENVIVIGLARMNRILAVDFPNERICVQPGVINLDVSRAVAPHGYYYAPDPSSQSVCSIGGNIAENSGGAHCFKYGFTTNYVVGLEVVLSDGTMVTLDRDAPGYDLLGAFVGSEGTLGVATKITLRVIPAPESVRTLLAFFADTAQAGQEETALDRCVVSRPLLDFTKSFIRGLRGHC